MSYLHQESTEEYVIQSDVMSEQEQQFVQQQKQRYQEYEAVMMGKRSKILEFQSTAYMYMYSTLTGYGLLSHLR